MSIRIYKLSGLDFYHIMRPVSYCGIYNVAGLDCH